MVTWLKEKLFMKLRWEFSIKALNRHKKKKKIEIIP
jgi:hypothetical protein